MMKTNNNPQNILDSWPKEAREATQPILEKYGEPDEMTQSMLIWYNNGPWVKTVATNEPTEHVFPMPHTDVVEQFISYHVPADKVDALTRFDGSVMYRRTEGLLSARCHDEPANFLALNLAHQIVTGKKTVEEAKEAYVQSMKDHRAKKPTPLMDGLQFQPQRGAADPGQQMVTKSELEAAAA
jgi:hypothetical protein